MNLVGRFLQSFLFFGNMIADGDVFVIADQLQQELDGGHALLPVLRLHGSRDFGVVVEDGGANGELDLDQHGGAEFVLFANAVELAQELDLLLPVRSLLA